jgi:hypothetical protein
MAKDEALKLALEALETELCIDWTNNDEFNASAEKMHEAITAIKEALAQPPQRPWVALTEEELDLIWLDCHGDCCLADGRILNYERALEAKLKEKNA